MGKRTKRQTINIPQEIVEEILYNLPVKSLSRFKCVSKQWRSLISGKDFVKQHLKRSSNTDHDSTDGFTDRHKLIFIFKYDQNRRLGLGSCSLRDEPTITPSYDNHPMGDSGLRTIVIVGSCNGLILVNNIHMTNLLLLWNPSTRKVKHIRPPSLDDDDEARAHYGLADMRFIYGLGYDETSDDYKVVCTKVSNHHHTYHTQMYSSKTDSWKKIQNFNKGFPGYHYSAKFVNGRFHWLAHRDRRIRGPRNIVSLRLSDEKYESVAQPSCFSNFNYDSHTLMLENLGGYLSLMSITAQWDVDVWAMMEYGKRESWTKIWTFSDFVDNFDRRLASGMPLCLNKNGDIAVAFGSDVVVYNRKKEVRKSRVDMLHAIAGSVVYVESLVSPFGIDDEQ